MDKIKKTIVKGYNNIKYWTVSNIKSDSIYNKGKVIFIGFILLMLLIKLITK